MKLAEKILESSIGRRIADLENRRKSSNKDIALMLRAMKSDLSSLRSDRDFRDQSTKIDNKKIKALDKIILRLGNIAAEIEKTKDVENAFRKNK